jgi:hypothetical protein
VSSRNMYRNLGFEAFVVPGLIIHKWAEGNTAVQSVCLSVARRTVLQVHCPTDIQRMFFNTVPQVSHLTASPFIALIYPTEFTHCHST